MRLPILVLAALPLVLLATPGTGRAQARTDDAFARAMFDPQLVLKHAQAIGLTAAQRRSILDELRATQLALAPLQADMTEPALELQSLIEAPRIDEAQALAKIDRVLRLENEVKKAQAVFVIRVKNILTPEQQTKLRALRDAESRNDDAPAPMSAPNANPGEQP